MQLSRSPFLRRPLLAAMMAVMGAGSASVLADGQVTIIHTGDFHGHLTARPNLRSNADYPGQMVGGLARIATEIKTIQAGKGGAGNTLVLHTGDTIQGSGEALYSRGQAMVDVVDMLGIDGYAPGNWDFVYGPERFKELFATSLNPNLPPLPEQAQGIRVAPPAGTRWGGVVSNLYVTSLVPNAPKNPQAELTAQDTNVSKAEYDAYAEWYAENGQRVLPPYSIKTVNGVKVGILGCTTSRGPQVVGQWVTDGLSFTDCANEIPKFAEELRTEHNVELVVLVSEIEIGRNISILQSKITKASQHIDVILNADMHEETMQPIEVMAGSGKSTWIIESGQDGTLVGEITLSVHAGEVTSMNHIAHRIDDRIAEDTAVANMVAQVSYPFNEGFTANTHINPFSGTYLNGPLSDVVGQTDVALHRSNYSHEAMPAVIEGSSHDFIADAIRWWAQSDLATVRGFRYGTHVAPGPITRNDLFHFAPIGPRVAKVSRISANQLRNQIDNSSLSVLSTTPNSSSIPRPNYNNAVYAPNGTKAGQSPGAGLPVLGLAGSPIGWGGGWLFAYAGNGGISFNFAPYFETSAQKLKASGVAGSGIDLTANAQTATPPTDTSRARSLKVKMICKDLPPLEIASKACNVADLTTRHETTITTATDGVYTGPWKATYTTGIYTPYLLNSDGWRFLNGTPNQPNTLSTVNQHFKAGLFTVAGYWYAQSPNSINNCNNCYPTGKSTVVGHVDTAYVLPVNAKADGTAALDENGNPIYKRNADNSIMIGADNKPVVDGDPIDLTVIIEKYLASLGTVTSVNLKLNRIGLVDNSGLNAITLPNYANTTLGFPTMQPLCGTIGKTAATAAVCPQ